VGDLWATKSENVGLIVRTISFQDFQPAWSWSTNVTDRRTDRQRDDMWSQNRSLHYSASRSKMITNSLQRSSHWMALKLNDCLRYRTWLTLGQVRYVVEWLTTHWEQVFIIMFILQVYFGLIYIPCPPVRSYDVMSCVDSSFKVNKVLASHRHAT